MNIQELLTKQVMQNNPNYQKVLEMVGDRNPREVFYEECKKRGVDPSMILKMLK